MTTGLPRQLEELVAYIHALGPGEGDQVRGLIQTVLDLHGAALARLLELIGQEEEVGRRIRTAAAQDGLVRNLLLLHGLHPMDLETRLREALAQVRPLLSSQGADVELVALADEAVRLRLHRRGTGYPASEQFLRGAIEEAIGTAAPDVHRIEFVGAEAEPGAPTTRIPLPILGQRS